MEYRCFWLQCFLIFFWSRQLAPSLSGRSPQPHVYTRAGDTPHVETCEIVSSKSSNSFPLFKSHLQRVWLARVANDSQAKTTNYSCESRQRHRFGPKLVQEASQFLNFVVTSSGPSWFVLTHALVTSPPQIWYLQLWILKAKNNKSVSFLNSVIWSVGAKSFSPMHPRQLPDILGIYWSTSILMRMMRLLT